MKIINVVPIAKGFSNETFSYFTSKNVEIGGIVSVTVRKRVVSGMVISSMDAKSAKIDLRNSEFALKSIKAVKAQKLVSANFLLACKEVAQHFVSPLGAVLLNFIPKTILDNVSDELCSKEPKGLVEPEFKLDVSFCGGKREERMQYYRGVIREEFARGHSVFFCVPNSSEMEEFSEGLKKGIEKYVISMHSLLTKKKLIEAWKLVEREKHPVLIVATKTFLSVPRKDLGVIIIDPEGSQSFKMEFRPYIDVRRAVEIIAARLGAKLIIGDSLVRTESQSKNTKSQLPRILSDADQVIVDMNRKENIETGKKEDFKILSPELLVLIEESISKGEKLVLFINRRGHAPTTVCNDCHKTILCLRCETPLVIHKEAGLGNKVKFICHRCLSEAVVPEQCPYCESWKLVSLGIGTQRVVEDLEAKFPKTKTFRIDGDLVKTKKKGEEIAETFYKTPGAILVGTESIFSYVKKPVDGVAVVSVDAAFTLPDFRVNEKVFQMLLKLRFLAQKTFLIQTKIPELKLFEDITRGNISGFYQEELENRKRFHYPPFKMLIKLTKGNADKSLLETEINNIVAQLKDHEVVNYPAFIPKEKNLYKWNVVIKVEPDVWPKGLATLHNFLFYLPQSWKVDVEPDSLL